MRYHFRIHKEKKCYWAEGVEIKYAHTQGNTMEELKKNMQEVLELCLEEVDEDPKFVPPMPDPTIKGRNIVEVSPNPKIALAVAIRRERIEAKLTQRETATRLGIKHVSQYQRLESGRSANAEFTTLVKLKKVFPDFSVDLVLA